MAKLRRDDTVLVIAGKDRGKQGKVRLVYPKASRLVVEGVNIVKRHMKARGVVRQAGIIQKEAPLHVSNVMLLCKSCHQPTRVGFRHLEDGRKVRFCKRCDEVQD